MAVDVEDLERRVKALESEARGEQVPTRRAFEHIHEIRDDIAVLRKHAATSGNELEQIKTRLGRLENEFSAFRRELPGQIADVMREVLKEQRR
jgi:chromosome segregation ATPase